MAPHEADRPVDLDDSRFGLDCSHVVEAPEKRAHDIEVEMSADERHVFHRLSGVAGDLCDLRAGCMPQLSGLRGGRGRGQRVVTPPAIMRCARSRVSRAS